MFQSPMLGIFRAAALAGFIVTPTGFAFAEASAIPPQSSSISSSGQPALAQSSSAAQDGGMSRGQQTMNSADSDARSGLGDDAKPRQEKRFSNEPDWMSAEYTGH